MLVALQPLHDFVRHHCRWPHLIVFWRKEQHRPGDVFDRDYRAFNSLLISHGCQEHRGQRKRLVVNRRGRWRAWHEWQWVPSKAPRRPRCRQSGFCPSLHHVTRRNRYYRTKLGKCGAEQEGKLTTTRGAQHPNGISADGGLRTKPIDGDFEVLQRDAHKLAR